MKTSHARLLAVALALLAGITLARVLPLSSAPLTTGADIVRNAIAAGGGHSASASYSLDATLGQALAGTGIGATTRMASGFWQADYRVYLPLVLR